MTKDKQDAEAAEPISHTAGPSLAVLPFEAFKKLYPAVRHFQKYDHNDRANLASSHRVGHRQRQALGEYFYTHALCPGLAFDTRGRAAEEGYQVYLARVEGSADLISALEVCSQLLENLHGRQILISNELGGHITLNFQDAVDDARAAIANASPARATGEDTHGGRDD